MTVNEIVSALGLAVVSELQDSAVTGAYAADLLSDVVGNAQPGNVLITVQVHRNVVAVAGLVGLAAVIITHGRVPDSDVLTAARDNNVTVLTTAESSFTVAGRLYALGVRSA